MVPDDAGNIDLLNQFAIPPVLIETILERSANLHSLLSLLVSDILANG